MYASNSVTHVLNHTKDDLCELGFLDIVHPCDQVQGERETVIYLWNICKFLANRKYGKSHIELRKSGSDPLAEF